MADDQPTEGSDEESKALVSDLFGIGSAAHSAAAKEVAKAFGKICSVLVDPTRTLLMGLAKTKVDTNRIVSIAKAEAEARQIAIASDELVERMKERVIAAEVRRQINLETIASEAAQLLDDKHAGSNSRPIEDDWMQQWAAGAQDATADEVRQFWSRVLASQAIAERNTITKPSLALLQNIDGELARALADYIAFLLTYGCYPDHDGINANVLSRRNLAMLSEIGFIRDSTQFFFSFDEFRLRLGARSTISSLHQTYALTHRGHELCVAIFGGDDPFANVLKGRRPTDEQIASTYSRFVSAAIQKGPHPIQLEFERTGALASIAVVISNKPIPDGGQTLSAVSSFFDANEMPLSKTSQEVISQLASDKHIQNIELLENKRAQPD